MTKHDRRKETRQLVDYLKSDLYELGRDYSEANQRFHAGSPGALKREIKDVPCNLDTEMVWGAPLGWRVKIGVIPAEGEDIMGEGDQQIELTIYDAAGDVYKVAPNERNPFSYDEANYDVGYNWLARNLP
jgi:hypothetical protein